MVVSVTQQRRRVAAVSIAMPMTVGALESAPARDHGAAAIISVSSALMHLPSVTMQTHQANPDMAGKIAQTHHPRRQRHLIVRPDKIEIVLGAADISSHVTAPPRQVAEIPEAALISPVADDIRTVVVPADSRPAPVADTSDEIACRPPQQLPVSHFFGPKTCRPRAVWAQYRKDDLDIAPDGIHIVPAHGPESRNVFTACPLSLSGNSMVRTFGVSSSSLSC
jgi:hypothetical protein